MIDYGALPPEINSGRMYAGPGAGPMLAAATAWDVLAVELGSAAAFFEMTVMDLTTGPWRGPAATSMAAATLPFVVWLKATAGQAEQAGSQAKAAAAAYAAAFAMTVPPPVIAANRAQLMLLIATNFFAQNTPAIAANEAHYAAMWAQDAAAMYTYAGSSLAASQVSPFTSPPQTTDPAGLSGPANSAADALGSAPGMPTTVPPAQATPPMTSAPYPLAELGSSTAPTVPGAPTTVAPGLQAFLDQWILFNRYTGSGFSPAPMAHAFSQVMMNGNTFQPAFSGVKGALADAAKAAGSAAKGVGMSAVTLPAAGGGMPLMGAGNAVRVGALSVPQSWPVAPTGTQAAATLVASRAAASASAEGTRGTMFGMPGFPGAAAAGSQGFRFVPRYGYRHRFMTRPPYAG